MTTTYSKSGIEKLSIYRDLVDTQLWLLAARNRVHNTCNATDAARIKPEHAKAICEYADHIYNTMFNKSKELIMKLDAAIQAAAAKTGSAEEMLNAKTVAKKIHKLNRHTMRAVSHMSQPAIEHKGFQPAEPGPTVTPPVDPNEVLDMDEYLQKLKAAANDLK